MLIIDDNQWSSIIKHILFAHFVFKIFIKFQTILEWSLVICSNEKIRPPLLFSSIESLNLSRLIPKSWTGLLLNIVELPLLMIETSHCVIKRFENTRDTIPTVYSNVASNPFHPHECVSLGQCSTKGEKNGDYKLQRSLAMGSPRSQKWKGNWFFIGGWITTFPWNSVGVVGFAK